MAYGRTNDAYPPPTPKKVAPAPRPNLSRAESTVSGGRAAPTGVASNPGHRSEALKLTCPPTPTGAKKGDAAYPEWNAPSSPVNQPNKDYKP